MSINFKKHTSLFTVICMFFTMVLVLSPISTVSAANTTYYVDSVAGNDSNNGTSTSTPWKTLSKVNATAFGAGDKILFKYNSTWTGQLKVTSSGASGNPITIGSYGGTSSKPIIAGSATGTELLSDPGFENATSGWSVNSPFSINTAAANARTGTKSLKLVAAGGWANTYPTSAVSVNTNTTYTFSAYIKGSGTVMLRVYDSAWSTVLSSQNFTATSSWTQVSVSVASGANTSLNPLFTDSTGGGGTIYIDDASFLGSTEAPVLLDNVSYVTVDGLEVTNDAASEGFRSGIKITSNSGSGTKYGITIKNNNIHNIKGYSTSTDGKQYFNAGIFMKPNTHFDGVTIDNNYIHDSSVMGFYDNAPAGSRMYNVLIQNNTVENTSAHGINIQNGEAPLIQYNRVINAGVNAVDSVAVDGIYPIATNNATMQYNYVEGTKRVLYDGYPWDFDFEMGGTNVFQYNYSRNNEGGFILYVTQSLTPAPTLIARYNISQNDGTNPDYYQGYFSLGKEVPIYFYNNVFYQSPANSTGFLMGWSGFADADKKGDFKNNVFYTSSTTTAYTTYAGTNRPFSNNSFYGHTPTNPGSNYITADPKFVNAGSGGTDINSVSGYKLQASSPLINAGLSIASNGGKDYWGGTLYNGTADIGAHEYGAASSSTTIPQSQMTATATSQQGGYEASKAIDGNNATFWHNQWSPATTLPQSITLNLGGSYNVTKLRYLPRQDGNPNGNITNYTIYVSTNGTTFTQVASGTWPDGWDFTEKSVTITGTGVSYVRLTATAGYGGAYAGAAEINIERQ
ncbi:discoidin domain-containing protein [Paenibacillus sp. LHD-117]|uniref:discoidin domain-containing protein n=1 Tax=Paenibacillus sp. LHD-117 TaxID=3071412 RepID=UPI0027E12205|nr:discoidin domain-containing protein [Paenibacillus sp. LHD-117]MDQ6423637.1 discoidin domain-containing protein [Paenibacillus sp. LHD-117]